MRTTALLLAMTLAFLGCASRSQINDDNPLKTASNLYNRNFVVAVSTYVGNIVCGAPFFFLSGAFDALYKGERTESYYTAINNFYVVPASACGAITGALFIPFSYGCKESPWDFGFKIKRNMSWACR